MTTEIKKEILDLAAALKKDATVEGGKVVFPKDVFKTHLPEGLTIEQVKAVNNYTSISDWWSGCKSTKRQQRT